MLSKRHDVCRDLATPKFLWDHPTLPNGAQMPFSCSQIEKSVTTSSDPYQVPLSSAAALLTQERKFWAAPMILLY